MSRIAARETGALPPEIRDVLADETARYGAPLNTTKVIAVHPTLLRVYREWAVEIAMIGGSLIIIRVWTR